VTNRVVDIESRIATSEASLERLRELIVQSDTVEVLASVEQQLLERETDLELLRAQLRSVRDRVDLATINLTLTSSIARPQVQLVVSSYRDHDDGLSCPAGGRQTIERGDDMTLCFEVVNVGDAPVQNVDVSDTALDLTMTDMTVVFGSLTEALEPGQSIVLAAEISPERTVRLRTRVKATPVGPDGGALAQQNVTTSADGSISVQDDGLPSIGEAFEGGWNLLVRIFRVLLLVVAALLPFIWLPIALYFLVPRFRRWRQSRREARMPPAPRAPTPSGHPAPPVADEQLVQAQTAAQSAAPAVQSSAETVVPDPPPPAP